MQHTRARLRRAAASGIYPRNSIFDPRSSVCRQRGSSLIVVVALLGILSLMGFLAYTLASQEYANAQYFASAAKARVERPAAAEVQPPEEKAAADGKRPAAEP